MKKEKTYIGVISFCEDFQNGCSVDMRKIKAMNYYDAESKLEAIGKAEYGGDFCVRQVLLLSDIIGERQ